MPMLPIRTVWLAGLMVAALATGCVGGGGNSREDESFIVSWRLVYLPLPTDPPGTRPDPVSCEEAATPKVVLLAKHTTTGTEYVDEFDCKAHGGQSKTLPVGDYVVTVQLLNQLPDGTRQVVSQLKGDFSLFRRRVTDLENVVFQVQTMQANWTLARGNSSPTCGEVKAENVELVTQLGSVRSVYKFPCADHRGNTTAVPVGTYSVSLRLLGANDAVLSLLQPMTFVAPATVTAVLPPITFEVQ